MIRRAKLARKRLSIRSEFVPAVAREMGWAATTATAARLRTHLEFAEEVIRIPEGRSQGERYRADRQPVQRFILQAFGDRSFNRFAGTGCVQSGKTLIFVDIPVAYHIRELQESVILFGPNMVTCFDKWKKEIEPVFRASPDLEWLLPRKGRGSRGGLSESIEFRNGTELKFMSAGGGDEKRSGYTGRVVVITEADKMDEGSETSRETNPITQVIQRTFSYDEDSWIGIESTVSIPTGRIWQEYESGTRFECMAQCQYCGEWSLPDRGCISGINESANVVQAGRQGHFSCPICLERWTSEDREFMVRQMKLVGRGQKIEKDGRIVGELAETDTWSIRWNAFHNLFWKSSFIIKHHWRARKSAEREDHEMEDLEREECQSFWTEPYEPPPLEDVKLDAESVRTKIGPWSREILPEDTECTGLGIDLGKYTCWWALLAGMPTGIHCPVYGAFTTPMSGKMNVKAAVLAALMQFWEDVLDVGFMEEASQNRQKASRVWIDGGWEPTVVSRFIRKVAPGRRSGFRLSRGRGQSMIRPTKYVGPIRKDRRVRWIGDHWFGQWNTKERVVETYFDADHHKLSIQHALDVPVGGLGGMTFYRSISSDPRHMEHSRISRHITNERLERVSDPVRGVTERWVKHGQNHWLDCLAMAHAALNDAGWALRMAA